MLFNRSFMWVAAVLVYLSGMSWQQCTQPRSGGRASPGQSIELAGGITIRLKPRCYLPPKTTIQQHCQSFWCQGLKACFAKSSLHKWSHRNNLGG
jgi:hypothetical protein